MYHANYDPNIAGANILGLYVDDIHKVIPAPSLQLTDLEWQDIVDNSDLRRIQDDVIVVIDPPLAGVIANNVALLNKSFLADLDAGFVSDALGTNHAYDSEPHNRENLIGAVAASEDTIYTCDDKLGNPDSKQQRLHTTAQLLQVLRDGKSAKQALIVKLRTLRVQVESATTEAEVNTINWS